MFYQLKYLKYNHLDKQKTVIYTNTRNIIFDKTILPVQNNRLHNSKFQLIARIRSMIMLTVKVQIF